MIQAVEVTVHIVGIKLISQCLYGQERVFVLLFVGVVFYVTLKMAKLYSMWEEPYAQRSAEFKNLPRVVFKD